MNLRARLFTLPSSLVLVLLSACGGSSAPATPPSDVPERLYLASAPPSPQAVGMVVAAAKDGDEIVVTGRVGGAQKVFVDGYAAFTIIDAAIPACGEGKMDECKTPWDYCCNAPEVLAKNGLSVELMADGQPLRANARGFHGLDHLSTVVVTGKVARDSAGNVRVLASGLHVQP
ncbi:MAG: hypothetical protein EXS08_13080 [Planctomycetes bacterium]|nr:hypothetical protein [Planctomycetota bacterium]